MTYEEKDKLLDRYVTGEPMSAAEEASVRDLIRTDEQFRLDYRLRSELVNAGRRERRANWEARLAESPLPGERPVFPMHWAAAASIVLVLGLGLLWWLRQSGETDLLTGTAPLFKQRGAQVGIAGNDSLATGTVAWEVRKASENEYEFSRLDTLRIFTTSPEQWKDKHWRLTSLSEVRYQLQVDGRTYLLKQGRTIRLPLEPVR